MVSTYTPNIRLEEPARGDLVGTWDTPVNNNMTLIDLVAGAVTTIPLNNSPVVLSAPQFQSKTIIFNSTLTGSVVITFPTSFTKSYEIINRCTGSSAFIIQLQTGAGNAIACKTGDPFEIVNDGANILYKNLGDVGTYHDYAGSVMPLWVGGCTVPPFLNCDGSVFSAVVYPRLAVVLGGTTLPDARGRGRAALNQGTGRMTTGAGGIDGNTLLAAGGADTETLTLAQLPTGIAGAAAITVTSTGFIAISNPAPSAIQVSPAATANIAPANASGGWSGVASLSGNVTITSSNTQGLAHTITQPTYIGGLTMIRAG